MRVAIVRKYKKSIAEYRKKIEEYGFEFVELKRGSKPDMILCVGGDGTFFTAEQKFPGVPKLLYRESKICKKCIDNDIDFALEKIKNGRYRIDKIMKLVVEVKGSDKHLVGVNDIVIRNKEQTRAIRFSVSVDGKDLCHEVVGDGVVFATPFGSTAYFFSITQSKFDKGIGMAFNNPTEPRDPLFFKPGSYIRFKLDRGKATLSADNNPKMIELKEGDEVVVKKSADIAKLVVLK